MHIHLVFVTKYRKKILGDIHIERLKEIFEDLSIDYDAELVECNGEDDHIHLLLETSPKTPSISKVVNGFKAVSSRRMRNEFSDLRSAYSKPVFWSRSYFAGSCGGAPLKVISEYVKNQRS
jgi:putative transposase